MRVLVLEPGYSPYIALFRNAEEASAQVIKGEHQVELPFGNNVIALVSSKNQDGLSDNRTITETQFIKGRAIICGWNGQSICGLTKKQADRYYRKYLYPEKIVEEWGVSMPVTLHPRAKPVDERFGRKPNWLER